MAPEPLKTNQSNFFSSSVFVFEIVIVTGVYEPKNFSQDLRGFEN